MASHVALTVPFVPGSGDAGPEARLVGPPLYSALGEGLGARQAELPHTPSLSPTGVQKCRIHRDSFPFCKCYLTLCKVSAQSIVLK